MKFALLTAATLLAVAAPAANAAVNIYVSNTSTGVFMQALGTLDLTGLTLRGPTSSGVGASVRGTAFLFTGPGSAAETAYAGFSGPSSFGDSDGLWTYASSGAGDAFGINVANGFVYVPAGYVSGAAIDSSATYNYKTIFALDNSSLELFTGTYVYTSAHDTITLHIGEAAPAAAVPEPASWAMMVGGFGLVGGAMRRRRKAVVTFA